MSPSAIARPTGPRALVADDEVLTGEAVALDLQPIGLGMRTLGGLIDMVAGWLLFLALLWGAGTIAAAGIIDQGTIQILTIVLLVMSFVGLPLTVETMTRGRSLGKLAAGGRIVRTDGGAIGFRHAFIRALVGVLEIYMTFGGIAILVGTFTPRAQRLGDLVAGTYSERVRRPKLPPPAPGVPPELVHWAEIADVSRLPPRVDSRVTRFATGGAKIDPRIRARLAADLMHDVAPFVTPLPDASPEVVLQGVAAVRRERDRTALENENIRVARLAGDSVVVFSSEPSAERAV
ncbi:RDD family protein [Microbacterium amylolyticum]|uniref:RDD family membrane protein YckC n=1 Tax=Microbacterium amylolyticum TaxID=936337 RepID=A0ABS4ZJX6_9MICO|nr:RDD family protein [Microbacterium amylolyticum]MBP2437586.1 putative RDD family membrane protein YckC [Microbacterium amylolyticum]